MIKVKLKRFINCKFGISLSPCKLYEAEPNGQYYHRVHHSASIWVSVANKDLIIFK